MRALIQKTALHSVIYGTGTVVSKLIGFVLIPLYLEVMSEAEYGVLSLVQITAQFLIIVMGLSMQTAFTRWFYTYEKTERKSIFFTIYASTTLYAILLVSILSLFRHDLSVLLTGTADHSRALLYMFLTVALDTVYVLYLTHLKMEKKSLAYSGINILKFVLQLSAILYFILVQNMTIEGVFLGYLCGSIITQVVLTPAILKRMQFRFHLIELKKIIHFSAPLIIGSLITIAFTMTDRYMLRFLGTLEDVAVYNLGFKLADSVRQLILFSAQTAISPLLYQFADAPNRDRIYNKLLQYLLFVLIPLVMLVALMGGDIIRLITDKSAYAGATPVIWLVCGSVLFIAMKDFFVIGLHLSNRTSRIAILTGFVLVLNGVLNYLLIPIYGATGAGIGILVSHVVFAIGMYRSAQSSLRIKYQLTQLGKLFGTGGILLLIGTYVSTLGWPTLWTILFNIVICALFPIALFAAGFYERQELSTIKQLLTGRSAGTDMSNI